MIGLPVELPADKARGYSSSAAESWMKQVALERLLVVPAASQGLTQPFCGAASRGRDARRLRTALVNEGGRVEGR